MVQEVGDKVIVGGEECEVVSMKAGGAMYLVKTPGGQVKPVSLEQIGGDEAEAEAEGEAEGEEGSEPGKSEEGQEQQEEQQT